MVDVRGDVLRPPHGTTPAYFVLNAFFYQSKCAVFGTAVEKGI